ncbi:MAG TPA: hypothetical protein VNE82_24325 [Candidatus Binataceae bacterium]|nr:hypothetical protein [Candidatus Binataceae bacterium]
MALDNDIAEQFANAVKLALEEPGAVGPPPEVATNPVRVRGHGRARQWRIALLYTALTATVAIVVVAALLR